MDWRNFFKSNLLLQAFGITLLLFVISYASVGWWTDSYQHMYDSAISGYLTNYYLKAAHNPFPEYMPGGAYIFNRLGAWMPIAWVAFFLNGVLFLSIWVLFYQILKYSVSFPWLSRLILVLFFSLLFFESVVLYHMVRITMFSGIAAVSYLIVNEEDRILTRRAIPYLLLFTAALWIRSNVHLFVLVFVTVVFFVHKKSLKPLIPFWFLFTLFFLFYCKVVFWTDYSNDLNSFFLYNTEFKLYYTGHYTPDLKLTQPLDSIKYQAIKNDILGDEQNLGTDFYERIGIFTNLNKFSISQMKYALGTFVSAMLDNVYFIIADLVLIFFYILLGGNKLRHYKSKTIGLFVFFYAMVFAICFIKMQNRFLVPFQVLFLFTIITLHQPKLFSEKRNIYYLVVFMLLIAPLSFSYIFKKIDYAKMQTEQFKSGFELLRKNFSNDVVVYNTGFVTMNRPYETFYQKEYFKKFYVYNYFSTHYAPLYRPYLEKECNCNIRSLYPFYDFLTLQNDRAILIDDKQRINVLNEYLKQVYNKHYLFEEYKGPGGELKFKGFQRDNIIFSLSSSEKSN